MQLQRSPFLTAYWNGDHLVVRDVASGRELPVDGAVLDILNRADRPVDRAQLLDARPAAEAEVDRLIEAGFLRDAGEPHPDLEALQTWKKWAPEAAFFHFGTKDQKFDPKPELRIIGPTPPPPATKQAPPDAFRQTLEPVPEGGEFVDTLLGRRTWRRYGDGGLTLSQLSTLMGLTWAVQAWAPGVVDERLAFKTSPSGGAKHSIEVYVAAMEVEGVEAATYHYDPDAHELVRVADAPSREQLESFLPTQEHFAAAPAVFFMSSVFARVQSKYRFPRAYRVIQLEAGHLAQTFCLTATWLSLAPFCTAALRDSAIEQHLGLDGIRESVLYVAGAGPRPGGEEWAPFGDDRTPPERTPPKHRQRSD